MLLQERVEKELAEKHERGEIQYKTYDNESISHEDVENTPSQPRKKRIALSTNAIAAVTVRINLYK